MIRLVIVGAFPLEQTISGLYRIDRIGLIVFAGSYQLDRIGWITSVLVLVLIGKTEFYTLAGLILYGWNGWTVWDVGGTGVGWRNRRKQAPEHERHHWRWNGSATIGYLGAEGGGKRWMVPIALVLQGRGVFFQRSKIIQIYCTQIGTNT